MDRHAEKLGAPAGGREGPQRGAGGQQRLRGLAGLHAAAHTCGSTIEHRCDSLGALTATRWRAAGLPLQPRAPGPARAVLPPSPTSQLLLAKPRPPARAIGAKSRSRSLCRALLFGNVAGSGANVGASGDRGSQHCLMPPAGCGGAAVPRHAASGRRSCCASAPCHCLHNRHSTRSRLEPTVDARCLVHEHWHTHPHQQGLAAQSELHAVLDTFQVQLQYRTHPPGQKLPCA